MFSSSQPVPQPTREGGYDLLEMRPSSQGYTVHQELLEFGERPTLRNAKRSLAAYNIPQPLRVHLNGDKGLKKREKRVPDKHHKGGSPGTFEELLIYDTMHDMLGDERSPLIIKDFERVASKKGIEIPRELRTLFLSKSHGFTRAAAEHMYKKTNTLLFATALDLTSNKIFDTVLFKRLEKVRPVFVLDNIVGSISPTSDISEGTIGYLGCAFILVLCANLKRLGLFQDPKQTIEIYDGVFLRMDGSYLNRFIYLFLRSIKRVAHVASVKVMPPPKTSIVQSHLQPIHFNKRFGTDAKIISQGGKDFISFRGTSYEIASHQPISPAHPDTIRFPHTKWEFYNHYISKRDTDLWYLNFLRDAYKADVAVQEGAIYITHDRLAHLYYRLIGGTRGILLAMDQVDGGRYIYKAAI